MDSVYTNHSQYVAKKHQQVGEPTETIQYLPDYMLFVPPQPTEKPTESPTETLAEACEKPSTIHLLFSFC